MRFRYGSRTWRVSALLEQGKGEAEIARGYFAQDKQEEQHDAT